MRYFMDAEFIEDGKTIDLISLALVAEDGREMYVINSDCKLRRANAWVKRNVIPQLPARHPQPPPYGSPREWSEATRWMPKKAIRDLVLLFVAQDTKPEFWGYYADYDWVVLCQLFGTMMDLPKGWPKYCHDIKQLADSLGNPKLPEQGKGEHHALADARWNRQAWEVLQGLRLSSFHFARW